MDTAVWKICPTFTKYDDNTHGGRLQVQLRTGPSEAIYMVLSLNRRPAKTSALFV